MNIFRSIANTVELSARGEPGLTIGIGAALPLVNPEEARLGMQVFRAFRRYDQYLDDESDDDSPKREIEEIAFAIHDEKPFLSNLISQGLYALERENEIRARWKYFGASDKEVEEVKIGNVWPYQRLAAAFLFKTIIQEVDNSNPFKRLAFYMQNGDDLRDIGQDLLNRLPLPFTQSTVENLVKENRKGYPYISPFSLLREQVKNVSTASLQLFRLSKLDEFNLLMSYVWGFASFSKVLIDAIGTFIDPRSIINVLRANAQLKKEFNKSK